MLLPRIVTGFCVLLAAVGLRDLPAYAQEPSLEERQPLELVYADSIVPQDRHETMLTTGAWYFRSGRINNGLLTQKAEWGISRSLQISATAQLMQTSNVSGSTATGVGDFEAGARYTWAAVGSRFTHIAVALDAGFPTGDVRKGLGEGVYTVRPSLLLSRELGAGTWQIFTTSGIEMVVARRPLNEPIADQPQHAVFADSGASLHAWRGWVVGELSVSSDRWSGGNNTTVLLTPLYVRRIAKRAELLGGMPIGLTSSSNHIGAVIKFTFELGGEAD
jgi:hypothetical protein